MKKFEKPERLIFASFGVFVFLLLLGVVALKLSIQRIRSEKSKKQDLIEVLNNNRMNLIAQIQLYESEPRICSAASDELGMVKNEEQTLKMSVYMNEITNK